MSGNQYYFLEGYLEEHPDAIQDPERARVMASASIVQWSCNYQNSWRIISISI